LKRKLPGSMYIIIDADRRKRLMTDLHPESARIYTFPVRTQAGDNSAGARQTDQQPGSVADLASRRVVSTALGSAWYHEAAIEDARRAADRK